MCGRFVRCSSIEEIAEHFNVGIPPFESEPSYNVAPTQDILIINNRGEKQLVKCHWGFLPSWSKEISDAYKIMLTTSL
jgi:putative SOS response-associated peptidase YedK